MSGLWLPPYRDVEPVRCGNALGLATIGAPMRRGASRGGSQSALALATAAAYKLGEASGTRADDTANHNDLTAVNTPTQVAGKIGNAVHFAAASSQYLSIVSNATIRFTTKFSISLWIKMDSATTSTMVAKGVAGSTAEWLLLALSGTGLDFYIGNTGYTIHGSVASVLTAGVWAHVVIVYDGTLTGNANRLKIYVDNVQQTLVFAGTIPATNSDSTGDMRVGYRPDNAQAMDGALDALLLFNTALSAGDVSTLNNGGAGVEYGSY